VFPDPVEKAGSQIAVGVAGFDVLQEVVVAYNAAHRIKIRSDPENAGTLVYHEDGGAGEPICGTRNRDWQDQTMHYTLVGPGEVTCGLCAKITDDRDRERREQDQRNAQAAEARAARAAQVREIKRSGQRLALPDLDAALERNPRRRDP
jgi:hypothetical protein